MDHFLGTPTTFAQCDPGDLIRVILPDHTSSFAFAVTPTLGDGPVQLAYTLNTGQVTFLHPHESVITYGRKYLIQESFDNDSFHGVDSLISGAILWTRTVEGEVKTSLMMKDNLNDMLFFDLKSGKSTARRVGVGFVLTKWSLFLRHHQTEKLMQIHQAG